MAIKFIIKREPKKKGEKKGQPIVNKQGQSIIYCRYTDHDNSEAKKYSKVFFTTKQKIDPRFWNDTIGEAKGSKASAINDLLNEFEGQILGDIRTVKVQGKYPTPENVKKAYEDRLIGSQVESALIDTISNQWRKYIDSRAIDVTRRTVTIYNQSLNVMNRYLDSISKSAMKPSTISLSFLDQYKIYLSSIYKPNTVAGHLKRLKEFLRYFQKRGGELKIKLDDIKYKETPKPKVYLTDLELKKLEDLDLKGGRAINRDTFILQCNTGLRISDMKNLDDNIEGNQIVLTTQKNDREVTIPINSKARQILEKYDYSLPKISEPVFNRDIKFICKKAIPDATVQVRNENRKLMPVPKHELITSHDAIRTFILLCLNRGMSLYSIALTTGKTMKVLERHYIPESAALASKEFMKAWDIEAPMKVAN
jgi:integrase